MTESTHFQDQVAVLRRTQILDTATKLFAERGFHRTTIRDIAKAAGMADGTIYNYFENKTALLLGILDRLNQTDQRETDLAQLADMALGEFIHQYIQKRLAHFSQSGLEITQVVLSEVLVNAELRQLYLDQIIAPTFALTESQFQQLVVQGKLPPQDFALKLRLMAATILGLILLRIMGDPITADGWGNLPDLLTKSILDSLELNKEM